MNEGPLIKKPNYYYLKGEVSKIEELKESKGEKKTLYLGIWIIQYGFKDNAPDYFKITVFNDEAVRLDKELEVGSVIGFEGYLKGEVKHGENGDFNNISIKMRRDSKIDIFGRSGY
jgi:hypothetical protein